MHAGRPLNPSARGPIAESMPPRLLAPATTAALLAAALLPAASSGATVTQTLSSITVANASTKQVIYYLDLQTEGQDERVSLRLTPPAFATKSGTAEGVAIDGPKQVVMQVGTGTVGQVVTTPSFEPLCSERTSAYHGFSTGPSTIDLALPANSSSRLAVRYALPRRAPWVDTDLRLRFAVLNQLFGTYPDESPFAAGATNVQSITSLVSTDAIPVKPAGSAKIGAHMILSTAPKGGSSDDAPKALRRGASVKVSGRLLPALAGKRINLQWGKPGAAPKTAKSVNTRAGGRFSATLKAPGTGPQDLWAAYPSQPGQLAADTTSCPIAFKVR